MSNVSQLSDQLAQYACVRAHRLTILLGQLGHVGQVLYFQRVRRAKVEDLATDRPEPNTFAGPSLPFRMRVALARHHATVRANN